MTQRPAGPPKRKGSPRVYGNRKVEKWQVSVLSKKSWCEEIKLRLAPVLHHYIQCNSWERWRPIWTDRCVLFQKGITRLAVCLQQTDFWGNGLIFLTPRVVPCDAQMLARGRFCRISCSCACTSRLRMAVAKGESRCNQTENVVSKLASYNTSTQVLDLTLRWTRPGTLMLFLVHPPTTFLVPTLPPRLSAHS